MEKKRTQRKCCVVDCENTPLENPELQFYRLPGFSYEIERIKIWIAAVRRQGTDGKPWLPRANSRICSAHFVGGEKSNNPLNKSYNPTIFPPIYKNKNKNLNAGLRAERLRQRQERIASMKVDTAPIQVDNNSAEIEVPMDEDRNIEINPIVSIEKHDVVTQTDPDFNVNDGSNNINTMFCWSNYNEASIQTKIYVDSEISENKRVIIVEKAIPTATTSSATDDNSGSPAEASTLERNIGFSGYECLTTDELMKKFTGIDLFFFHILLKFIVPEQEGQPAFFKKVSAANRLLIFLMMMKLGLSFAVIGCLFKVSQTSAASIFSSVLKTLTVKTKTWIFWPSKEAIRETLPQSFSNYPNCRAIIDCTELRTDTPPTVEQRILMYSTYKSNFTVKFLIGISPSGMITFVSKAYGGKATDGFISNDSGFLNLIEAGDQILADKGFPQINSELIKRQSVLIMPPFAYNPQFSREEVLLGYSIASVRIHVERAIQRVKVFKILDHIYIELLDNIDDIIFMACVLANNKEPLIRK